MSLLVALTTLATAVSAISISQINGANFVSPLAAQSVSNVSGIVTAKGPDGLWLRDPLPSSDRRTSDAIYVFGRAFASNLSVGDGIVLGGRVSEYRSNRDYLYLTQIDRPTLSVRVSSGNSVKPLVIGKDTPSPPTEAYSSLDNGDVLGVPNNVSLISTSNPTLEPSKYGLDFWESLSGELVTVQKPVALTKPNQYGDTWVRGNWKVTGKNERGGLTMTPGDANPEAIVIGSPLDGSKNPTTTQMGDEVEEITGIVTYAFGFYRILPTTAMKVTKTQKKVAKATKLESKGRCEGITVGAYNVENLAPNSTHHGALAEHIVKYMRSPDILFVQEVQDDNGPTNDAGELLSNGCHNIGLRGVTGPMSRRAGLLADIQTSANGVAVVSANLTLTTLAAAIRVAGGPQYAFTDIAPVDDKDGGQPGGNIRTAYLYKPELIRLYKSNPGGSLDANQVLDGPTLKYNPGRIDPANEAWTASRKPLAAQWEVISTKGSNKKKDVFFTVNVHFGSKGGSSSLHGDARPPVNGGLQDRISQSIITANFVKVCTLLEPYAGKRRLRYAVGGHAT
jgi:predicted extracellular nuclease